MLKEHKSHSVRSDVCQLSILGPFRFAAGDGVAGDERLIELSSPKIQTLLAYLAVESGYAHARDRLATLLWPESPKTQAFQNLRQSVARLQKQIKAVNGAAVCLRVDRQTMQVQDGEAFWLDCDEFSAILAAVHRHEHVDLATCQPCCEALARAAMLYRGEFLAGVPLEGEELTEWATLKRAWFRREALQLLDTLVRHAEGSGDAEAAYHYAWRRVEIDPLLEEAHCQVMMALALSQRRNEALAQYTTLQEMLEREIGAQPMARTTALYTVIREEDAATLLQALQAWQADGQGADGGVAALHAGATWVDAPYTVDASPPTRPRTWQDVPDVPALYGRTGELADLVRMIGRERQRVVALLGMGGMGKTTLAAATVLRLSDPPQGASQIGRAVGDEGFAYVFWQSLINKPELDAILPLILQTFAGQSMARLPQDMDGQLALLLTLLRRQRCLLVLDNLESILAQGEAVNGYLPEYQSYGQLIQLFAERDHQSCLLLTSRELPYDGRGLAHVREAGRARIALLSLRGLDVEAGVQLLAQAGNDVTDVAWRGQIAELVARCSGNPLALKLMAQTIQELFDGDIRAYLQVIAAHDEAGHDDPGQASMATPSVVGNIQTVLDEQLARLSPQEMDVVIWLAVEREAVRIHEVQQNVWDRGAQRDLLATVQSLQRRSLLERRGEGITLPHVVIEHVTQRVIGEICAEIEELQPRRLASHALLKAQAKEYVRQSQARLLLAPIAAYLVRKFGREGSAEQLRLLLDQVRAGARRQPGYVAGNVLNLLLHMGENLRGYDFSELCVWQADLREANLQDTNFRGADLSGAVFGHLFHTVNSVAFSPDRRLLAAGSGDGAIYVWRTADYQLEQVCVGSARLIWSIAFSPDGRWLAGSGDDQSIQIWDVATGNLLDSLQGATPEQGHRGWIKSIAFSPTGELLVSGGDDGLVCLWRVDGAPQEQWVATLAGHTNGVECVAFSPDGQMVASGGQDQLLQLWSVAQQSRIRTLMGQQGAVTAVAFHPDGEMLASGAHDGLVQLWDVRSGRRLQQLAGHAGGVEALAFSEDGALLASASRDQTVRLWQLRRESDGEEATGEYAVDVLDTLYGHTNLVKTVAFDGTGQTLASAGQDRTIRLWSLAQSEQAATTPAVRPLYTLAGQASWVISMAFSPDGRWLATGGNDRAIRLWPSGTLPMPTYPAHTVAAHPGWVRGVAFNARGDMIASGDDDGVVRLWALHPHGHFTPFGRLPRLRSGWIETLVFRPQDDLLAVGDNNGVVTLWDVGDVARPRVVARLDHRQAHVEAGGEAQGRSVWVASLAFSPRGDVLASGGSDNTACLWRVGGDDQPIATRPWRRLQAHTGWVDAVAFSPDGRWLASSGFDGKVLVWEVESGALQRVLAEDRGIVKSVAFSPDGNYLAAGGWKRALWVWGMDGTLVHTLLGHTHTISNVAFHPDPPDGNSTLASSGYDATVRLWDAATGTSRQRLLPLAPYAGMQIAGAVGLSEAQRTTLRALGAVDG